MTTMANHAHDLAERPDDDLDFYPEVSDTTADFELLDVYDEAPSSTGQARPDALATISAGERVYSNAADKIGQPKVSRDGTIYLHDADGRAPGLAAALAATGRKSLTIAFPFSDLRLFWMERFTRYSASRLEVYGDSSEIREILQGNPPEHRLHLAGSPDYDRLRRTCKVSTSLYFALAEWQGPPWIPRTVFPDGLALYRLRTTSRHSRRSLLGALETASRFTGGQLAGLPFELRLSYREVADPSGTKRTIPVWSLLFKPPSQIALSTNTWPSLRDAALAEGRVLSSMPALAAPSQENWHTAQAEDDVLTEPSDTDLAMMLRGDAPADAEHWRRVWFSVTDHTIFSQEVARHRFFERYTEGRCHGLAEFLKDASNEQAQEMVKAAVDELNQASGVGAPTNLQRAADRYTQIFGKEDEPLQPTRPVYTPPTGQAEEDEPFGVEPEPVPEGPPADADEQEATAQWLSELWRQIAERHMAQGLADLAPREERETIANGLLQVTQGDVEEASRLLKLLTRGAPASTSTARKLTKAQAGLLAGVVQRPEWLTCAGAALRWRG